jgi:hypothetical protein
VFFWSIVRYKITRDLVSHEQVEEVLKQEIRVKVRREEKNGRNE